MRAIDFKNLDATEVAACQIVENICRSLGKDCQVIFGTRVVSVAPPIWGGDSTGTTLAEALEDALKSI